MDDVFALVQKGEKGIMTRPAVPGGIVAFSRSFLFAVTGKHTGIEGEPVFSDCVPGDELGEICPYVLGKNLCRFDSLDLVEHPREGRCCVGQSPYPKHLCED